MEVSSLLGNVGVQVGDHVVPDGGRYRGMPGVLARFDLVQSGQLRSYPVVRLRDGREVRVTTVSPLVHACPPEGAYETPCCHRSPHELLAHRITLDPARVTCGVGG